ncbi:TPR repeat region-containing protein [Streptomyces marincola]|uniref:TPR repeat region-containing protein n=1 Tax=Streptomyces marincola TaxID=2878388 RepID=UPI001CF26F93|nr:hypothetical protein [Streptomyces marincola]UCM89407.1 hypothetical protein LC193_16430 [Streptomyces marincola]
MSDISITKQDVIDKAGCDPWELESEFASDTDLEMIDSLAGIFRNGAEEADDAGGVAAYASTLEERAGTRGSNAIYADASEHLTQTYEDLGAENLENISSVLNQVAGEAEAVLESNDEAITGPMGLDWVVETQNTAAQDDWSAFESWFAEQSGGEHDLFSYTIHEETFTGTRPTFPKDDLKSHIRDYRLELAADSASRAYDRMFEDVDDYYAMLHQKEGQLSEYGYDVSDSPVPFWHTDGRAEHEAEQLHELLQEDNPDPEELERYSAGVDRLVNGLDGGELTSQERAYLRSFYDTLSADDLATLGALEGEAYDGVRETVANGVNTLMSPARGGLHPTEDAALVPDSIKPMMDDDLLDPDLSEDEVRERVAQYNGLGELMSHASMRPGDVFGEEVATAAIHIEEDYQHWDREIASQAISGSGNYIRDVDDLASLTGGSDMLTMVSTNPEAAARTLTDPELLEKLVTLRWNADEGEAAGAFIGAATTPPADGEPSRNQLDAARNVLQVVGPDTAIGDGAQPREAVTSAILDTGLAYLDFLANTGQEGVEENTALTLLGDEVPGFVLTQEERAAYFEFVAGQEQNLKDQFYGGVQRHAYERTLDAFNDDSVDIGQYMGNLADLHGAIDAGEFALARENHPFNEERATDEAGTAVQRNWAAGFELATAINDTIGLIPAAGSVTGITGEVLGVAETVVGEYVGPPPTQEEIMENRRYETILDQGGDMRYWFAQAAAESGNIPGVSREDAEALADVRENSPSQYRDRLAELETSGGYHDPVLDRYWDRRSELVLGAPNPAPAE